MSFQAYLDTIEKKTGLTPRELLDQARNAASRDPGVTAGDVRAGSTASRQSPAERHGLSSRDVLRQPAFAYFWSATTIGPSAVRSRGSRFRCSSSRS